MTTNQEGRQAAIRDSTSTAYGVAADWHALFDDAGISAGTFNERLLAWINAELSASYSNLVSAMQAYAEDAGYDGWEDMATLVLAMNGAETLLDGETQGLAFDFTDQSALIIDTGTPANNYDSTGIVSSGSLVGPSGKLTYTSPSNKLTLQADGYYKYQAHNLYLNSAAPANQSITVVSGASYAVTITGTVSVTASGAATGTWTAGTNTFTAATTTLTLGSTSGSGTVHVRRTPSNDDYIETAGAAKYALPLEYDTSGNCLGLLVEEARTNLCLYSNDLTQAGSWTASSMTTAKTATGPDNVANSATTITASAGNATILQAITSASAARVTSVYIKRRTGTGNIDLTQDNGSTWTTQAVDSSWTRFSLSSVTSANPTVGIRIVTSGDAVDVALFSHEVGAFVTSPILTYGAAATRLGDDISIALTSTPIPDFTSSAHTIGMFAEYISRATVGTAAILSISDSSSSDYALIYENGSRLPAFIYQTSNAGGQGANLFDVAGQTEGATVSIAARLKEDDVVVSYTGRSQDTDSTADLAGTAFDLIGIGRHYSSAQPSQIIRKIVLAPSEWSNATLEEKVGN